jgi:polyvinyl alcohol dehydrogenase (cytochrome)
VNPAVHGQDLIIGDIESGNKTHGASILDISRATGSLCWITKVDAQPTAISTGSPVVMEDVVYVGVSSSEELSPSILRTPAPVFAEACWRWMPIPAASFGRDSPYRIIPGQTDGYSGRAIWQPPTVDPTRGLMFIGTGNNYTA